MTVAGKTRALMQAIGPADIAAMTPAERRAFADECRRLIYLADAAQPAMALRRLKPMPTAVGVLAELKRGFRGHGQW